MTEMQSFPLNTAFLCQDCDHVGNSERTCPTCGSSALMSLAPVLNRVTQSQAEFNFRSVRAS